MTTSPELIRFHAAGHLAAAHSLATAGQGMAASHVLKIVRDFMESPRVSSPPALKTQLDAAIEKPVTSLDEIALLEQWFCDPFNTIIERSGN